MTSPDKIIIVDRFAPLRTHLLGLLAELDEDDWARPTAAPLWSVKDVATHLLGGDIGSSRASAIAFVLIRRSIATPN